jgi:hypothetical protein
MIANYVDDATNVLKELPLMTLNYGCLSVIMLLWWLMIANYVDNATQFQEESPL